MGSLDYLKIVDPQLINQHSLFHTGKVGRAVLARGEL